MPTFGFTHSLTSRSAIITSVRRGAGRMAGWLEDLALVPDGQHNDGVARGDADGGQDEEGHRHQGHVHLAMA